MAHIRARRRADGSCGYTAHIRIFDKKRLVHEEAKTFSRRVAAEKWSKAREVELENPAALSRAQEGELLLCRLIRWYIDTFRSVSNWGRSKQMNLEFLERHPIGQKDAMQLTASTLTAHVKARRDAGASPSTAATDLIWIGVVLRAAHTVEGLPVRPEVVEEARNACRELRLTGKGRKRERRPTAEEKKALREHFSSRDRRAKIPMNDIWDFATESARREDEICRLEWTDNDPMTRTGLVRDAKHPRHKDGNHKRFKYTPEAWEIVQRQPKTSKYIFPYNAKSISTAFTRACHVLGIIDLHFHDGRHEATSQLFERGYEIQEVAQFTLHESWNELKRYTNLRPENLRDLAPRAPTPPSSSVSTSATGDTELPTAHAA